MTLQSLMCRVGLHAWAKPRRHREGGFLLTRRRCRGCRMVQERQFPGGGWQIVPPAKRIRRKAKPMAEATEAEAAKMAGKA